MEKFLNPNKILDKLELQENLIAADFGCGTGGWAIPLAKKLKKGKVFALDIQEEMLSALRSHTQLEKIYNIETKICDIETKNGSNLRENSLDLVLVTNLLFQIENVKTILQETKRILKKQGKVLIVDWYADIPFGPKQERIPAKEVKKIAEEIGLNFEKKFDAGGYHYGLIFEKP